MTLEKFQMMNNLEFEIRGFQIRARMIGFKSGFLLIIYYSLLLFLFGFVLVNLGSMLSGFSVGVGVGI